MRKLKGIIINGEYLGNKVAYNGLFNAIYNISPVIIAEFIKQVSDYGARYSPLRITGFDLPEDYRIIIRFENKKYRGYADLSFVVENYHLKVVNTDVNVVSLKSEKSRRNEEEAIEDIEEHGEYPSNDKLTIGLNNRTDVRDDVEFLDELGEEKTSDEKYSEDNKKEYNERGEPTLEHLENSIEEHLEYAKENESGEQSTDFFEGQDENNEEIEKSSESVNDEQVKNEDNDDNKAVDEMGMLPCQMCPLIMLGRVGMCGMPGGNFANGGYANGGAAGNFANGGYANGGAGGNFANGGYANGGAGGNFANGGYANGGAGGNFANGGYANGGAGGNFANGGYANGGAGGNFANGGYTNGGAGGNYANGGYTNGGAGGNFANGGYANGGAGGNFANGGYADNISSSREKSRSKSSSLDDDFLDDVEEEKKLKNNNTESDELEQKADDLGSQEVMPNSANENSLVPFNNELNNNLDGNNNEENSENEENTEKGEDVGVDEYLNALKVVAAVKKRKIRPFKVFQKGQRTEVKVLDKKSFLVGDVVYRWGDVFYVNG